jgi:hypothetical protein
MRMKILAGKLLATAISLALFAGCSGGSHLPPAPQSLNQSSVAQQPVFLSQALGPTNHTGIANFNPNLPRNPQVFHTWIIDPAAATTDDFFSDFLNEVIDIFDPSTKKMVGQIAGLNNPEGLASNPDGTGTKLYEVDQGTESIRVYSAPYTKTPEIIPDTGYYGIGIHVDKSGDIFVANQTNDGGTPPGDVVEYVHGSKTSKKLPGGPREPEFVTTDSKGNLWGDGYTTTGTEVGEWPLVSGVYKTFVKSKITLKSPGSLEFDSKGNLLLCDQEGAADMGAIIHVYPAGKTTPSKSITVQTNGSQVVTFALHDAENELVAPNATHGYVKLVSYPAGDPLGHYFPTSASVLIGSASIPEPGP